jgi:hypothetical protein
LIIYSFSTNRSINVQVTSTSRRLDAVKEFPEESGRFVFFNSMVAAYLGWRDVRNTPENAVTFSDGGKLDGPKIDYCAEVMEEVCVDLLWQKGDLACIDNHLCMHARRVFIPPRRLLAYVAV